MYESMIQYPKQILTFFSSTMCQSLLLYHSAKLRRTRSGKVRSALHLAFPSLISLRDAMRRNTTKFNPDTFLL